MSDTRPPHLIWVTPNDLRTTLDAATFLDTADEMRKLGWQVSLLCGVSSGTTQVRGIDVVPIPSPNIYFFGQHIFHQRALRFIKRQKPPADVVLFHQVSGLWMLSLHLWRRLRRRSHPLIVLDTRSVYMPDKSTRQQIKGVLRETYYHLINWAANRWADGQTAITAHIAQSIPIPPDKLWGCWPSGVTPARFTSSAAQRQWPNPSETIKLIYIGSTHYERNLLTLAEAVCQTNQNATQFHLTIIGDGAQQEELKAFAREHPKDLTVHDPIPHEEIPHRLAQAHVGALPFPDEEKFRVSSPIKLFEYMAAGLPVMATRIVCHTDVMADADYAFYANGADVPALTACLKNIARHTRDLPALGQQAMQAADQWSWAAAARKLDKALKQGLASAESRKND
jgi:glycosyltransferase involved in cell wall biosynthesis